MASKAGKVVGILRPVTIIDPTLKQLVGVPEATRGTITKKLWEYIKEKKLQNPSNTREIINDELFEKMFKVKKMSMFEMNKHVAKLVEKSKGLEQVSSLGEVPKFTSKNPADLDKMVERMPSKVSRLPKQPTE